jgi:hypothetical protein
VFERHYFYLIISQPCRVQWYVSSLCLTRSSVFAD